MHWPIKLPAHIGLSCCCPIAVAIFDSLTQEREDTLPREIAYLWMCAIRADFLTHNLSTAKSMFGSAMWTFF